MATAHEVRSAYIASHQQDLFSMFFVGDIRPLIEDKQHTSNEQLFSGNSVRLVGGTNAYWKHTDGYFFVCGNAVEMKDLYDVMIHSYELLKIDINGVEVISIRALPRAQKQTTVEVALTVFDFTERAEQAFFER